MPTTYSERLTVPLRWWVWATFFLATFWLAFIVALPEWIAWAGTGVLVAAVYAMFLWVGSARVEVRDGVLHVGPAHIGLSLIGEVEALDKEGTRRVHGPQADARAFLHTRPYISRAVRIAIDDPADPTPYWLVSSRHPRTLAAALSVRDNAV
ncbi:MAG: DUF3093 domain-containing protein [Marmoricola sp.]